MRAVDIIIKKRQGLVLDEAEIRYLVEGYVKGSIPDYQISAFLMTVFFKGMTPQETAVLTAAMLNSGETVDLSGLPGIKIDKHSTGGVGDKVSLILAPVAAALGITVPMMAGRGLGHTGGTLDKLESIPGYSTRLREAEFKDILLKTGFAITGQTEKIVPADKKMYALRDVSGTVESIPLITASIMSKKCAEGADGFVFDVKCGSGAFMKSLADARLLADSLVNLGRELGRDVKAVITDMNCPLGRTVGNFLEIIEAGQCLQGRGPDDLMEITLRLGGWMLVIGGMEKDIDTAVARCHEVISNGTAWQKFLENVSAQGGNTAAVIDPTEGPAASCRQDLISPSGGYIKSIDAYKTGLASVLLGAGRARKEDPVSPGAGIILQKKPGQEVKKGDVLCTMFCDDSHLFDNAKQLLQQAYIFSKAPAVPGTLILQEI